jgi:hypothetical protein
MRQGVSVQLAIGLARPASTEQKQVSPASRSSELSSSLQIKPITALARVPLLSFTNSDFADILERSWALR